MKSMLEKLDMDSDIITLLETERITTFRKMENLNDDAFVELRSKLKTLASKADLLYLNRLIVSINFAKIKELSVPAYETANNDEIENFIMNSSEQSESSSKSPTLNAQQTSSNKPKRSLTSFNDCKMPKVPVTVKKMNQFKISFINILRSMKLEYLLEESFVEPLETDTSFHSFEDDNSFLYSALIKVTEGHEALRWINKETVKDDDVISSSI